eukprot:scaffold33044_cov17-Tisochrysis_lutea.AAC.2
MLLQCCARAWWLGSPGLRLRQVSPLSPAPCPCLLQVMWLQYCGRAWLSSRQAGCASWTQKRPRGATSLPPYWLLH